jgi:hypothetical protein
MDRIDYSDFDHNSTEYQDYINSFEWKEKRREVFSHYGQICQACKISSKTLDVHHKTYKNFGKNEPMEDVVPLCRDCHEDIHQIHKRNRYSSAYKPLGQVTEEYLLNKTAVRDVAGYSRIELPKATKEMVLRKPPRKKKTIVPAPAQKPKPKPSISQNSSFKSTPKEILAYLNRFKQREEIQQAQEIAAKYNASPQPDFMHLFPLNDFTQKIWKWNSNTQSFSLRQSVIDELIRITPNRPLSKNQLRKRRAAKKAQRANNINKKNK